MDVNFYHAKLSVFAILGKETQQAVPKEENPFWVYLDKVSAKFQEDVVYYDFDEPQEFNAAYETLKGHNLNETSLCAFRNFLILRLIADRYHVNSYVQESLVDVYRATEEVSYWLRHPREKSGSRALHLFQRLTRFEPRLEVSLQRGAVRWGFLKSRKFVHWDIVVVFRYLYSLVWVCPAAECRLAPIEKEIESILQEMRHVAKSFKD